ncbi:MAG TPA: peptidyl-prolyl cis-trans isomerase [Anaeromyxobacteraceae bacterium]|nr:peptidyl-prolyl cis-trans isomerase [Anaeromyxobacteraceae bacterium]
MRPFLVVTAAVALLATACERGGSGPKSAPGDRPVALVNGKPISAEALRRELALARSGEGEDAPVSAALRRRTVEDLVDRALLVSEAQRRGIAAPPAEVERAFEAIREQYPDAATFDAELAKEQLAPADVKARLSEQLTVARLVETAVFPSVTVTEEAARRVYDEHAAEYEQPAQVHALQIVTRSRDDAEKARAELRRRPQAFAEVARRTSIAPEAEQGGELGWFGRDSGMPEVFHACFDLPVGQVSAVVPSPYGFHVFKVLERRPARRRPFAEVRDEIARGLLRDARSTAQENFLASLRSKAQIAIDDAALASAAPTGAP